MEKIDTVRPEETALRDAVEDAAERAVAAHNRNVRTARQAGREEAIREIVADLAKQADAEEALAMKKQVGSDTGWQEHRTRSVDLTWLAERYETGRHMEGQ
jgi:hypothetical protein